MAEMISHKVHAKISQYVKVLQRFVDRIWYPPLLGLLAAMDNFVVVIPNDGLLISSSMLRPKRWFTLAFWIAIGSSLGAFLLAVLVETHGMPWILDMFPGIETSYGWIWTDKFFDSYGLFLVFAVAASPLLQQPAVILASLASTPLLQLTLIVFFGRMLKFLVMSYVSSHAPRMITKLWGVKSELKDVGIKVE